MQHLEQSSLRLQVDDAFRVTICLIFDLVDELIELSIEVFEKLAVIVILDHLGPLAAQLPESVIRASQLSNRLVIDSVRLDERLVVGYVAAARVLERRELGGRYRERAPSVLHPCR